ncbi:MAG: L,D-transpeptidase family protein [Solirubrobacteraceae bacterium]
MASERILLTCCAGAFLLATTPAIAAAPLAGERIAPGVTAAGLDLSGLTVDEAAQRLESLGPRLEDGSVTVVAADVRFRLRSSDAKVDFDEQLTARRALRAGGAAAGASVDTPLAITHGESAVRRFTGRIDKRLSRDARDSRAVITLRRVKITHSRTGRDIDSLALARQISRALTDPRAGRVFRPRLQKVKPKVTAARARRNAGTVITIDQSAFKLRLFKNLKVVRTYGVAVGQPQFPTPNGRYAIQSKQVNPVWSVPNSPWAGELSGSTVGGGSAANPLKARWMGVAGSIGIHGTGEGQSIGSRASHGCVRMHVSDVKALFSRVPLGAPVLIAR